MSSGRLPFPYAIGSDRWPGTSRVLEESGELTQVLGKLMATGGDADHWSGDLRKKLVEEIGDLSAALAFFRERNLTVNEQDDVDVQMGLKLRLFRKWHEDPRPPPTREDGFVRGAQGPERKQ